MTSLSFHPFSSWQCPRCHRLYDKDDDDDGDCKNKMMMMTTTTKQEQEDSIGGNDVSANFCSSSALPFLFLRGTCHHDVCIHCIVSSSISFPRTKKKAKHDKDTIHAKEERNHNIVTVSCPLLLGMIQKKDDDDDDDNGDADNSTTTQENFRALKRTFFCHGKFHVHGTMLKSWCTSTLENSMLPTSLTRTDKLLSRKNGEDHDETLFYDTHLVSPQNNTNIKPDPYDYDDQTVVYDNSMFPSATTSGIITEPAAEDDVVKEDLIDDDTLLYDAHLVSPPEALSNTTIKSDPDHGYDDQTIVVHEDDEKFYDEQLDVSSSESVSMAEIVREVKRHRRLNPSMEARLQCSEFWSVNPYDIQFTEQAFVHNPLFHLNSFLGGKGKAKVNEGFSELIKAGIATPGFLPLPKTLDIEKISSLTYKELRDTLTRLNSADFGGSVPTALWLKNSTVGSFVIMRHEYANCQFCPKRLIVDGKYIGPVYVIGIITKKVVPWSSEEREIAEKDMSSFSSTRWPIHNVCRVRWEKMGYAMSLESSTREYISRICQPTLQQICQDPKKVYDGGGTSESVRRDLWAKATISISSNDFPDSFTHHGIPEKRRRQLFQAVL